MTTQTAPAQSSAPLLAPLRATPAQNVVTIVLGFWLMVGIFIDGWAHNHLGTRLETFFTPWHAIFYSGFAATALWVGVLARRGLQSGRRGLAALPVGYTLGAAGVVVFALGGLGDMLWHTLFGIEVSIDALLSPTHLLLFLGAELLVLSPLMSSWHAPTPRHSPAGVVWPAVLSMTAALSFASFMHMYAWALVQLPDASGWEGARSFLTSTLLTAVMLMVPVLLLLRRWQLPFGAVTVLYLTNTLLMRAMTSGLDTVPVVLLLALLAGLAADVLIWWLQPSPGRPLQYRAFATALPLLVWAPFFIGGQRFGGFGASLELTAGVCVMAALAGLALSTLIVPPALPEAAQERPGR
ncbi:hypothetical protein [Deinococcus sonorensis]|uniref:Uncharacterized protein n=2 Tax=Deinococcus sonorensis TaxID=309891 RepID=A0AAU7UE97_9DEIO